MSKTKIEWCDYTINPVKGLCPMACSYCYARAMHKRFKWDESIRFDWSVYNDIPKIKNPSRIFWGSTMELFGEWVDPEWMRLIFEAVKHHPEHTHIFLTKQPQNLIKFSPFPDNAWVGVTATHTTYFAEACAHLRNVEARVKYLSIEPYLGRIAGDEMDKMMLEVAGIKWVIIGQQTPVSATTTPKIEWIEEVTYSCDMAGIPVFHKDNLKSLFPNKNPTLRQSFPDTKKEEGLTLLE